MRDPHALIDRPPPLTLDFQRIFALVPTPLMVLDRDLAIVYANAAYLRATGCRLSHIQGRHVFESFPEAPERVAVFHAAFTRALAGHPSVVDAAPFRVPGDDGLPREVIWTCSHTPIPDDHGDVAFVLQHAADVTEAVASAKHSAVLLREFSHRVKNTMATVQAVARRSMVESKTMPEARDDLLARIQAMANVHNLLLDRNLSRTEFHAVLNQALAPFGLGGHADARITLAGPPLALCARQAQAISMAIHELATNALKYGALSDDGGQVAVRWSFDGATLDLTWTETGGPAVAPPTSRGFGTVMLSDIVSQEIDGSIVLDYRAEGVICRMRGRIDAPD